MKKTSLAILSWVVLPAVSALAAPFTAGNLAVLQAESSSANNTTASIIELSPSAAAQSPTNVIAISGDGTNALRISGSASTTGFLATSADGTRLALMGANNTNTSSNVNTLNPRGVGVLDAWGNSTLPTTYTGISGNQTRCATTLDNSAWWIADQGGIYSNGTTTASPAGNMRSIKAFGTTVYVSQASSTVTAIQVSTLSAATGGTLTGLPGLANNSSLSDFYIISSGENGAAFDVLYVITSSSIAKFSLVAGTWTANGSYTGLGGFAITAKDSGTGAELFISTGGGALSANSVVKLTDAAGHNAAINITTGNNVTLYTAPTGKTVKGVAFAPAPPQVILTEINSNAAGGDFWELTNVGPTSVDLGNWKWLDGGQTTPPSPSTPAPAVQVFPAGTTLASGETMVIITDTSVSTTFLNAWGPLTGIQRLVGGPGLGMNDSVKLYDQNDNLVFNFTYAASGFTQSGGSAAAGGHAGASAGGAATQSAVIDPAFGTGAGKRYRAATVGVDGGYANTSGGNNIGSPGVTGISFGGGPSLALTLGVVPATFSESATNPAATATVTRTGSTTAELVVTLSSSDTTEATVPATVTIAAGQASASFDVTAVNDTFPDGSKTATITASAPGATPGTFDVTVQDDGDVLDTSFLLTEVLSQQAASGVNDFWELTNISGSTKDISGYSWHDSGRSAGAAAAYKLPAGSTIAAGESVIFTTITPAAFRAWWGISESVKVFQTVGAPGLGQNDGVSFFDSGGNELFFFNYAAGGFTKADGNPSTGTHAGPSAGAATETQSAVWDPTSGTTTPRYTFATVGQLGAIASAANAADIASPGVSVGNPTVSIGSASVLEGNSGTRTLSLPVTRSSTATAFTVGYAVTGGTATSGDDYQTLAAGTLTFSAGGGASQNIDLTILGDILSEPDETILVTLSNVVNSTGTTIIVTATGTGTITNDDTISPVITTEPADTTIASGYTATLSLVATGTPAPTVQWYRGNAGDTTNPVGTGGASFTTPALTATTSYWARVSNTGGNADSRTAVVTVTTGPVAVDLSTYVRVGRYNLPEYRRTPLPNGTASHNLLCDEASAVAYNWETDTLFITGDGGRSITQVTKSGQLVNTMSLELSPGKPQGVEFYDPEGITYIGNGEFVFSEERERRLVKFTYAAGTTLTRATAQTVDIGTFDDNTGTEGLSWDPQTSGYIVLKEKSPIGVFQTGLDFVNGTATNGSPTTVNSTNLFDTTLLGMTDVADVFALSNLPSMSGQPQAGNLLVLGQEDARVVNISRTGVIHSTLQITSDSGNPLSAADQQHEGITMDRAGIIYIVNENGGGSIEFPQLWVYAPSVATNQPPTALALNNAVNSLQENTSTVSPIKLGDIVVTDDGLGTNTLSLTGADAASFQITGTSLFLKAGVVLDFETKTSYSITLQVDDTSIGATPDATLAYTLTVTDQVVETPAPPALIITEVAPWASGNGAVGGDWFEVTNVSANAVDITGWKVDDSSNEFGTAIALNGITSIAPGESVIFIESTSGNQATIVNTFKTVWFGASAPSSLQVGTYQGSGIGLSTSGDAVYLFTAGGARHSGVTFGAADGTSPYQTFDNTAALNNTAISLLSQVGVNGAFVAATSAVEIGSPGYAAPGVLRITEVAPWSSGNSPVAADWFEVTNVGARAVDITGWKVDDSSESPAAAVPLSGVTSIAPGESVIFLESANLSAIRTSFLSNWFGASPPARLQVGAYSGGGVGLGTGGDAVNLYDTNNVRRASVSFGIAPSSAPFRTFENAAAADVVAITTLSTVGVNGAFTAVNSSTEVGSPGLIVSPPRNDTTVSIADASIAEGNTGTTALVFTVTRSDTLGSFTVAYATNASGNASAGTDFVTTSGTLSFTAGGADTQTLSITLNGDTDIEPNETFTVVLSNVVNSAGTATISRATATGTITNDDTPPVAFPAGNQLTATVKGSIALAGAEIPAFDPLSKRAFASSGTGIQVVDLTNPSTPAFVSTITPSTLGVAGLTSDDISSVAVRKGFGSNPAVLAAAIISNPKTNAGFVVFLNAATGALLGHATVGVVPDHIAWTPDGTKLLVCNEGELDGTSATLPDAAAGSVSIIAVDAAGVPGTVQTAGFAAFDAQAATLKAAGVRLFGSSLPSTDFEPEYLAISPDGTKAMVTLQEANAVAILDIAAATFTSVVPLGKKDFSTLRADFSDQDGVKNPRTGFPVFGLYMPDAIAAYSSGGQTYYVTANEGDDRNDFLTPDESTTVGNAGYSLDSTKFPNASTLKQNTQLGRLVVSNFAGLRGDTDNDGDVDEILMYGARSFSILDAAGNLVFDSGDMIEMIVASLHNSQFDDSRSDNKGPEPEGVAVAAIGARTFAFVGLERSHMTLVFDVTNPMAPTYVTSLIRNGDLNPEGMAVVSETDSPSGRPLVLVTNEVSNTLSIFELTPTADYTLQLLHFADAEAGLLASQTAPNLAALVDAFDGSYANTIILAGGDNYIPGPFAAAGTDDLVAATHNKGNNPFAADIEIHNRIGVEASTVGNHEFDFGTNAFSDAILDTNFPYLSANLNFSGDAGISARYQETVGVGGLEEASSVKNKVVPSCVITRGGQKIGLVGATTQVLRAISSAGNVLVKGNPSGDDMALLASQLQPVINDLKSQGVNKIILMAHLQQIANELMLAPLLTDVDIILAAGSNTRLGDANDLAVAFPGHAADFAGNYPIYTAGADGKPTVVVNTDNEFTYLGRLVADFDAEGVLIVPNLLANTAVNGAYAATAANVAAAWNTTESNLAATAFAAGTKGALVKQITDAVQGVINAKDGDVRGYTNVYLEGERNFVRNQETNLGNISADSMVTVGKTALPDVTHVVALKNGGGIRAAIGAVEVGSGAKLPPIANPGAGKPAGAISRLDIENSMRFNNGLMLCETTPAGLKAILEHGVALLGSQGRFPQIGGMSFSFDSTLPAGSRVRSVALTDLDGNITAHVIANGSVAAGAPASITLVTLNFLANNGDSYPFKPNADNFRYLLSSGGLSGSTDESLNFTAAGVVPANIMGEQAALSSHLQARHATPATAYSLADTPIPQDTRIQQLQQRADTVLLSGPISLSLATVIRYYWNSEAEITLTRTGSAAASVRLRTADGTASTVPPFAAAQAGVDYVAVDTVVQFAAGETSKTIPVSLLLRPASTPNRRFTVTISEPSPGSTLGAVSTAEVRLLGSDIVRPGLAVTSPAASGITLSTTSPYLVTGTAGDVGGIDRVEVVLNGAAPVRAVLGRAVVPTAVPWSLSITPRAGLNTLFVTAYDLAGNFVIVSRSFTFSQRHTLAVRRSAPAGTDLDNAGRVDVLTNPAASTAQPLVPNASPRDYAMVPGKSVRLTAVPRPGFLFSHWAAIPSGAVAAGPVLTFTMPTQDVAAEAVFVENSLLSATGAGNVFTGLLTPEVGTPAGNHTTGSITLTLVPATGTLSGRVFINGLNQPFTGLILGNGTVLFNTGSAAAPVFSGTTLVFDRGARVLTLAFAAGGIQASVLANGGSLVSSGLLERAAHSAANPLPDDLLNERVPASAAAPNRAFITLALPSKSQTPALPAESYPQGDGYATLVVDRLGTATLVGVLADGTAMTASSIVLDGGRLPAFVRLVTPGQPSKEGSLGGSLSGMLQLDTTQPDSDVTGADLTWFRPAVVQRSTGGLAAIGATRLYTAGWPTGIAVDAVGALYSKTSTLQDALGLAAPHPVDGNAVLRFSGGRLTADIEISELNIVGSAVQKIPVANPAFTLVPSISTGTFSGTFRPGWLTPSRAASSFRGMVLQKGASRGGYGFFLSDRVNDLDPESSRVTLGTP